jgi:hypothetical protein
MKKIVLSLIFLFVLNACSVPVTGDPVNRTPETDLQIPISETLTADAADTAVVIVPTATLTSQPSIQAPQPEFGATHTPPPTVTPPQFIDPHVITIKAANVYSGPGMNFELYYSLGEGISVPVQGRSEDGQWWAVPGPGDGPGPLGWIHTADVQFYGDLNLVVILPPPNTAPPEFPVHLDPGSPPSNACVVFPRGVAMPLIRLGPGEQFGGVAYLGNWVEVLGTEMGWYMVDLGPGTTGWVYGEEVRLEGECDSIVILPPDSGQPVPPNPGDWPVHSDPGSPPANTCVVYPRGAGMPLIRLGPGEQFNGVAYLGNWAEVLKTEMNWYMILLGPGDTGWVNGQEVRLEGPCP